MELFFVRTCIHVTLTFSESSGLIFEVIKPGRGLFSGFYNIWEIEVEDSIQSSRRLYIKGL